MVPRWLVHGPHFEEQDIKEYLCQTMGGPQSGGRDKVLSFRWFMALKAPVKTQMLSWENELNTSSYVRGMHCELGFTSLSVAHTPLEQSTCCDRGSPLCRGVLSTKAGTDRCLLSA